jgi:integrase
MQVTVKAKPAKSTSPRPLPGRPRNPETDGDILRAAGDILIEEGYRALTMERLRGEFKSWRDKFANTPRKADYAWTTLARLMSFAKDRGIIAANPCERGGRLYAADRKDKIWSEQDIAAVLSVASTEIQLALILALWSGQRQGDLLRLPWSAYESPYIRLRQSKGGRRVVMPAGSPLRALLDATARRGPLILTNTLGRPWTSDGFRTSWGKACERAGIGGLTFHDLRGTAVVRLAIAGATVPQIAAVTGHSLKDVEAILDAHYLGRDIQLAEAAVLKLEARTKL